MPEKGHENVCFNRSVRSDDFIWFNLLLNFVKSTDSEGTAFVVRKGSFTPLTLGTDYDYSIPNFCHNILFVGQVEDDFMVCKYVVITYIETSRSCSQMLKKRGHISHMPYRYNYVT